MKRYNPLEIEKKWQDRWEADGTYTVDLNDHTKPKYLGFSMLPGITGAGIHIGHGRTFQFSDIKVRAKRQQGYNAYNPIGWDSFGLPVENYAIKLGKKPREAHDEAKENFIRQLKRLGYSYDWSKEISTADPSYYKWTQWIFNKLYEHDLAYQKESPQWWCETDQTVLANEQVESGKCWRCGNLVVKRNLKQWFFRITAYADEMLDATDDLNWTDMVKTMQKNWIGKSQGAEVEFRVAHLGDGEREIGNRDIIKVFTTRPDTLFGATFMVLAPEHEMVASLTTEHQKTVVEEYVRAAQAKSEIERMETDREKTGVFTGSYAINPANGEKIPIWVADYVLAGYGTGAIMAVPAHDERDGEFAAKFGIPVKQVVAPYFSPDADNELKPGSPLLERNTIIVALKHWKDDSYLGLKWATKGWQSFLVGGIDDGETLEEAAIREIKEESGYINLKIEKVIDHKLISEFYAAHKDLNRRMVGNQLIVKLVDDERIEVSPEEQALHELEWIPSTELVDFMNLSQHKYMAEIVTGGDKTVIGEGMLINSGIFDRMLTSDAREEIVAWLEQQGVGRSKVQYRMRDWLISRQRYWGAPIPIIHCDTDGAVPVPDDQLPVILPDVDDYKPTGGNTSALAGVTEWVNTTCPKCGGPGKRETDTMDGYACSSWYFLRYIDPFNDKQAWDPEIAKHWQPTDYYNGADHAVAHLLYSRFWMRFFHKLGLVPTPEPFKRMMYNAYIMAPDGQKMSKSKGNVIDPMEIMDSGYGADALRVYEMFIAPYDQDAPWDTRGVPGTYRFLNRVWNLTQEYIDATESKTTDCDSEILRIAHSTVKKVTSDIEDDKFNTAIAAMMESVNNLYKLKESVGISRSDAWKFAIEGLMQVLAPFAPHITDELWNQLGNSETIHIDHWPHWDDTLIATDSMMIIVQVNGKLRAKLELAKGTSDDDVKAAAMADGNVQKFITDKKPTKVVYVPGRLVNVVI
ncbi:MAG: class I tRNA ligase family protein [Candidatus Saccharimonadaceae bacterium]